MEQLVLLDTTVAAGILSNLTSKDQASKRDRWKTCILDLIKTESNPRVTIPTPIFFELASWEERWHQAITELLRQPTHSRFFEYINYSIKPQILLTAARYKFLCRQKKHSNGEKQYEENKRGWVDSLVASYCLTYGYHLITINQKDFPEKYFEVKNHCLAPLITEKDQRKVVFLLAPRQEKWLMEIAKS